MASLIKTLNKVAWWIATVKPWIATTPLYTLHVSGELVHDFCGVIKPTTAHADVWQTNWNTALLRRSVSTATISNEHNQTNKKHMVNEKTLLDVRDSKSHTLIISRTHDIRFTAPDEVFWWQRYKRDNKHHLNKRARKKQRDCAPTSFSAVLIMSQSTLDMSTFWQSFGYGIKIKQSTSGANAQKRGASVAWEAGIITCKDRSTQTWSKATTEYTHHMSHHERRDMRLDELHNLITRIADHNTNTQQTQSRAPTQ